VALLNYGNPIRFDFGVVRRLSDELAKLSISRPLVVTDCGVRAASLVDKVVDGRHEQVSTIYDGTPGNPTEDAVIEALSLPGRELRWRGLHWRGSPIDLGKAVSLLAVSGGSLAQYDPLNGVTSEKGVAPLVAIPTTAGTGSEASFGFLINVNDGRKLTFASPAARTNSGIWRTIKPPRGQSRCPPIRKQSFRNSGFREVADPRYQLSPHSLDRLLGRATHLAGRLFLQRHHVDAPISAFTRMLEGRRCEKLVAKVAHWRRNVRIRCPSLELRA
jgi:Iron-containing alcohol dehydrogenase